MDALNETGKRSQDQIQSIALYCSNRVLQLNDNLIFLYEY